MPLRGWEGKMDMVTAVRSQVPGLPSAALARPEPAGRTPLVEAARPVSAPAREDAPAQTTAAAASVSARLAERDESRHPAAEARIAADAAREAYIRASIAAGVSPLPLP
jgi:hypothetical protein